MSNLCHKLHHRFNQLERFRFPFDETRIPRNGIYVLFEAGERAHGGDRIVRVGTHTGQNQLRSRLKQHFVRENKDRSIFRKNIGRALLAQAGDPFLEQWEWDLTSRKNRERYGPLVDRAKLAQVERRVTETIQQISHSWSSRWRTKTSGCYWNPGLSPPSPGVRRAGHPPIGWAFIPPSSKYGRVVCGW